MSPIAELQTSIRSALLADAPFVGLVGTATVTDAPAREQQLPMVVFDQHNVRNLAGDDAPFLRHEVEMHIWVDGADRAAAAAIEHELRRVLNDDNLNTASQIVSHRHHVRTRSSFDRRSGHTRLTVQFVFNSEPAN